MTPAEHFHALQAYGKTQELEMQITHNAARTGAWLVVNHIPFLKKRYKTPQHLLKWPWEKEYEERYQTVKEMKMAVMAMAVAFKGNKEIKSRKELKNDRKHR